MYTLYEYPPSGNCYKLRLAMSHLQIDYKNVPVDILKQESRTTAFLEKNPNGRTPVLEIAPQKYIWESNAALWYISAGTSLRVDDNYLQAQMLQWMFFEQYSHEPYIATSRYWISILKEQEKYQAQLDEKRPWGYAALDVMEGQLQRNKFMAGDNYSVADICLFAYTHVADQGGFDLARYPAISDWIAAIQQTKNFETLYR